MAPHSTWGIFEVKSTPPQVVGGVQFASLINVRNTAEADHLSNDHLPLTKT